VLPATSCVRYVSFAASWAERAVRNGHPVTQEEKLLQPSHRMQCVLQGKGVLLQLRKKLTYV
jgi:hypothetical protein